MRNLFTIIVLLFFTNFLVAQTSEWRVLGGFKNATSWQGSQSYTINDIDVAWDIYSTSPISAHTFSILYGHSFYPKWSWSVGININQKGYLEKGIFKDAYEPTQRPYYNEKIRPYWGFLIGSQYEFYKKNSWACNIELLINPETEKYGYSDAKKWGLSSLLMLNIEKSISKHFAVSCIPLLETSMINYLKKDSPIKYSPYSYGLMIGLKYSK